MVIHVRSRDRDPCDYESYFDDFRDKLLMDSGHFTKLGVNIGKLIDVLFVSDYLISQQCACGKLEIGKRVIDEIDISNLLMIEIGGDQWN
jgi:hypothetical protein